MNCIKKVKEKRGRKIAYVRISDELRADNRIIINFYGEKRLVVGPSTGKALSEVTWDIEDTHIISSRVVSNFKADLVMDDEAFTTEFRYQAKMKWVK